MYKKYFLYFALSLITTCVYSEEFFRKNYVYATPNCDMPKVIRWWIDAPSKQFSLAIWQEEKKLKTLKIDSWRYGNGLERGDFYFNYGSDNWEEIVSFFSDNTMQVMKVIERNNIKISNYKWIDSGKQTQKFVACYNNFATETIANAYKNFVNSSLTQTQTQTQTQLSQPESQCTNYDPNYVDPTTLWGIDGRRHIGTNSGVISTDQLLGNKSTADTTDITGWQRTADPNWIRNPRDYSDIRLAPPGWKPDNETPRPSYKSLCEASQNSLRSRNLAKSEADRQAANRVAARQAYLSNNCVGTPKVWSGIYEWLSSKYSSDYNSIRLLRVEYDDWECRAIFNTSRGVKVCEVEFDTNKSINEVKQCFNR